ncbi:NAD-dependent epimerase/dehydratase family protein [Kutzneria kofuensis]|uniref:Nucleoside-diphosphate-sugar epimerase n=1 Tax=Kutzneria kofuensis TaxID=103725 RepID=A0A7W9NLL7_9PSEU|nr:NAD-dependent epimerase/dehydratase family protein [Kutzneria kofuensis]MBB5896904.1 nucleoside-diphosphate-sugar epimerase [Kutzneria kofuensis]
MRLLVIGGTAFVGRAIVADALARGHKVTTFNRGLTGQDADGVEALRGDRSTDAGLRELTGRSFDAVIDPGGLVPAHVLRTARAELAPFYAFVSTTAVYRSWTTAGTDESAPTWPGVPDEDGDPDLARLGVRKRGCELAVEQTFGPDAAVIARAGMIVGPHDNVGQLPWWLTRIAQGGRVLAPGDPDRGLQLIDVRDLSAFVLDQVEARAGGIHNVVPDEPNTTMGHLVDDCAQATGSTAEAVWVDEGFLFSQGVQPWAELPLWIPDGPATAGFWAVSGASAKAAGLRTRPVAESVRDTWEWLRSGGEVRLTPGAAPFGIAGEKEQQVLTAWDARSVV